MQVTTPGGTSATSVDNQYTYVPVPVVTAIHPDAGPAAGGNTVTITGTDLAGATITFGSGNNATDVSCTTTSCTAVAPTGNAGDVHVQATTIGGTSATSVDNQYTYVPAPTITAVSPNTGPPAGGNTVTITGTDLAGATITFGSGNNATDVSCTATSCTAVVPAGSIGTLHVQATTIGGTSATSVDNQYTYAAADLSVAMTATGVPGLLNGHIDYTITITNKGPSTLSSATVTATLPIPMTATSSDCTTGAGNVTCAVGPLASGASVTRSIRVPVGLLTIGIPYTVTATRTASAPVDLNPNNDSASRSCTVVSSLIILCH